MAVSRESVWASPLKVGGEAKRPFSGDPSSFQGAASPNDPQGRRLRRARGGPAASLPGQQNHSRSFPAGRVTAQQQQELEATCSRLQRQVGEMEVREAAAQGCLPLGTWLGALLSGSPSHKPCKSFCRTNPESEGWPLPTPSVSPGASPLPPRACLLFFDPIELFPPQDLGPWERFFPPSPGESSLSLSLKSGWGPFPGGLSLPVGLRAARTQGRPCSCWLLHSQEPA